MIRLTTSYMNPSFLVNRSFLRAVGTNAPKIQDSQKASPEQLQAAAENISEKFTKFFVDHHDYRIYTKDVVFVDNIRSLKTHGVKAYAIQMSLIKAYYTINYASSKFELLNLVKIPEESCIRVRWRLIMKPGLMRMYLYSFYKPDKKEQWKDGISTIYVNREGLVYCHICDNIDMDVDMKEGKLKKTIKSQLVDRGISV